MNNGIDKSLERWHCDDSRFPPKTSRPVGNKSLDTLKGVLVDEQGYLIENQEEAKEQGIGTLVDGLQLQPVGVIKKGKQHIFAWGNGRLQRIRDFYAEGWHSGYVDVLVMEGVDPRDRATLSLIENNSRSPNEFGDYKTLLELRQKNPMISYIEVYNLTGMPIATQKKLDKEYKEVPLWASNAMLRGELTKGAAKAIAKLGTDTQADLKAQFKANGNYLSLSEVEEKKRFIQEQAYAPVILSLLPAQPKQYYDRSVLEDIREYFVAAYHNIHSNHDIGLAKDNLQAGWQKIDSLLAETE